MKKIYFAFSALLLSASMSFAQVEIRAFEGGVAVGNDISGTTVTAITEQDGLVAKTFSVKNTSGSAAALRIQRLRIDEVAAWTDGLCWGPYPDPNFEGHCYGAGQMLTNPWTNPHDANLTTNGDGNLVLDIHTEGAGTALYRYYVMNGSVKVDSIDLQVTSVLGMDELEEKAGMTAYPNPANGQLTVATTGVEGTVELRITDVLGKVVYNEEVGATKKVDVSEFKNGVYLVTVLRKGESIQTRRVVVKH